MIPGITPIRSVSRLFSVTAGLLIAFAGFSQSMNFPGELQPGDTKLGRYFDTYSLQLTAGERIVATLSSSDFDAYLILESPAGREIENDDYNEQTYISRIGLFAPAEGEYIVTTAGYDAGAEGSYTLKIYSFGTGGLRSRNTHQLAIAGRYQQ
jgi:hypothetical protein